MARNLVVNGVTYHNVEALEMTNENGEKVLYTEGGGGGSAGDSGLPAGYKRVDYIKFSGDQLVDTGIIGNQDTEINVCFTREVSAQRYLFGCAHSGNTAAITAYQGGTWRFGNKYATKQISTVNDNIGHFAFVNKTTIGATGSISTISDVNDFETIGTLLLGGCRSSDGSLPSTLFVGKIFFFAMWQGAEQVLKLMPVASADGAYRFYDDVSGRFFDSITDTPLEGGNL